MPKYKYRSIPQVQTKGVYAEGKQAFNEGKRRGANPYTANNVALAAIWWHGWDTGEEEKQAPPPSKRKP